jgi:trigger factor
MKKDEKKEFKLKFPPDYPRAELVGKEPSFKVRVTEIKQERLPELNDKLAREINPEFKTLKSLRKQVSADLRLGAERKARVDFEDRVIEAVVKIAQVEFPPILVDTEIDRLINQQLQRWQMSREGLEEYLKRVKKTEQELREELHPIATKRVTDSLVLGKIAEEEKIEASDSEIGAEIKRLTKGDAEKDDELRGYLNTTQSRESIRQMLITRKTIERLVEIAKGSAVKTKKAVDSKVKEGKND